MTVQKKYPWDLWLKYDHIRIHLNPVKKYSMSWLKCFAPHKVFKKHHIQILSKRNGDMWVDVFVVDRSLADPPLDRSHGSFLDVPTEVLQMPSDVICVPCKDPEQCEPSPCDEHRATPQDLERMREAEREEDEIRREILEQMADDEELSGLYSS